METNIGKQIRAHRLRCNMTQEKLAEALNVTAQAVSKWETGLSYPDITLLPELSSLLGVTLDTLFDSAAQTHLQRIERMIENNVILSREDFDYAEKHLKDGCLDLQTKGRCLTMLGELYNHRARMYRDRAAEIAKQALEIEPDKHDNHAVLCEAMNGVFMDWCITNHTAIIEYYKYFIKKNPHDRAGYMWLIDNLIIDGRFSEAKEALESMRRIKDTYHYLMYKGWIVRFESGWEQAQPYWDEMVEKYADDWHTWSSRGDAYAKRGQYKLAISDYRRATELECAPRFTDNFDSIAQISLLMEDKKGAIEAYEQVVRILREEWDMQEGETVLGYLQNIAQLKSEL